jgi:hypothetical protein
MIPCGAMLGLKLHASILLLRSLEVMEAQRPTESRRILVAAGVVLLLGAMAAQLALSARRQSQTFDEGAHIFSGYRYWKNFDFGFNPEHPPLLKLVAALPLLRLSLRTPSIPDADFKMVEFRTGRDFLYGNDAGIILFRARMAAATFTLCLALCIFLLAQCMWGDGPAFIALALFVFDPNFLAHGALVTTDIAVTLGIFLGVASFYFYLKNPTAPRLVGAGLAAGICLSSKHSGILLFLMLLLLMLTELVTWEEVTARKLAPDFVARALRLTASLAAISTISLVVLWSVYGFRFAARPAGLKVNPPLPEFVQQMGHGSSGIVLLMARLHLLPESYLYGIADISSVGTIPTVIFGRYYPSAQWFYFPSVFVVKSTLAFLLLCCLLPLCAKFWGKPVKREMFFLVIPPAVYLIVAMSSGINYGIRHLLPIYPFLIVLVSFAAWNFGQRNRAFAIVVAAVVVFHAASSLHAFPNYIPYSNELWGGPSKTHAILADSNVDWGQGLVAMKQYINENHIENCWFAYFGQLIVDVSYYGIRCKPLPTAFADMIHMPMAIVPPQVDGPVFISATEVTRTYWRADWINPYLPFQGVAPTALIADSILVYDGKVDLSEVSALTHENRALEFLNDHKLEQALAEADIAVSVAPNRPVAQVTRGRVLLAMGRNAEADDELRIADSLANRILAQGHR